MVPAPQNPDRLGHPKYRPDIDGMRAIAVLSIVGFHFFPGWIKGGFIGVDIFFVISGYLISTIIFENLEHNRFSFIEFYSRRIKRIFPALLLILIVFFAIGWITLLADEFKQLGKHIAGGAGFIANFLFWNESGYFDAAAETKPLLHLWSLGIEEQFYIVWPLFLWFGWKRRLNLLTLTIAVALISFTLNILQVQGDAVAAFYSPQTRFWELLAGSVLAYLTLYKQNIVASFHNKSCLRRTTITKLPISALYSALSHNGRSLTGALLIAAGLILITKERIFPHWWALLPTIGTVLLISAGSHAWLNRTILSNRVLVWFGLISFPLYLWHWPFLSFVRILQSDTPSPGVRIIVIALSVALAWLTYRLIERPVRFGRHHNAKTVILLSFMVLVGSIGYNSYRQEEGLPHRKVVQINPTKATGWDGGAEGHLVNQCGIANEDVKKLFGTCDQDSRQTPKYALLGDSKAAALYRGLIRTSKENGRWLCIGGNGPHGAPVPVLSDSRIYRSHQKLTSIAIGAIASNKDIETVALMTATRMLFRLSNDHSIAGLAGSKHYQAALEGLTNTTSKLIKAGKKIVLIVDNPTLPDPKDCLERTTSSELLNKILLGKPNERCKIALSRHLDLSKKYRDLLQEVKASDPLNITIFDTTEHMCDSDLGICQSFKNGRLMYRYTDHVSDYAAGLIGKDLNDFLQHD